MANYECTIKTNYFKVKNIEEFKNFISNVCGDSDIHLFSLEDKGNTLYAFGSYGCISGIETSDGDYDYDAFIEGLQQNIPEDEAILIYESGHEKLRYLTGSVTVVTTNTYKYLDIFDIGIDIVREIIPNYKISMN